MSGLTDRDALRLVGEKLVLRPVTPDDVTDDYIAWMNDLEVNRFMETRFRTHTRETVGAFVDEMRRNPNVTFLAMTLKESGRHVGNIKLAARPEHSVGEISLFIGDRSQWGRGLGGEAIALVRDFGRDVLKLYKLTAGCYAGNIGSRRAFENSGFHCEALLKADRVCDGGRTDLIRLAYFGEEPE